MKKSPFWSIGVLLFILGQLFFTYKGVESFPFVNWGMYSGNFPSKNVYEIVLLKVNGQEINLYEWPRTRRAAFSKIIRYYRSWQKNGYTDVNEALVQSRFDWVCKSCSQLIISKITHQGISNDNFKTWLHTYLSQFFEASIREMQVIVAYYNYEERDIMPDDTILLHYQHTK